MKKTVCNLTKLVVLVAIITFSFSIITGCGRSSHGGGTLVTEAVDPPVVPDKPKDPSDGNGDEDIHNLFGQEPGKYVSINSLGGAIDPVGTTIVSDFDGDGIDNDDETTTNVWVADYPVIETTIAPPVSMKIEVLLSGTTTVKDFNSDITSEDTEKNSQYANEAAHRNEVKLRTVQYKDSFNWSKSDSKSESKSKSGSAGIGFKGLGASGSGSNSSSYSESHSRSYGETKTKWKDVPFKNNMQKQAWSVKRDTAAKKAMNLRREIRTETSNNYEIKPNAGYVKAALYITNESVNMPVKLRDILCTFMLEDPAGQLIPIQSFRLRNDDYSIFEIELYGNTTFGPYVIELENLNTLEIKNAIENGYNPKIFIVDYEMTHVDDSNYRMALSENFTGNNLKIIEENAKGRTAGVKIVGPSLREFFRVVAFDTDGNEHRTGSDGVSAIAPGVSLEKALTRIGYSGVDIEFADYVLDMSDLGPMEGRPEMDIKYLHVRGIKKIGNFRTYIPNIGEQNGAIIMKPISTWTEDDFACFKLWVVYDKGRYYNHSGDGDPAGFVFTDYEGETRTAHRITGISSMVWPGDHYDIVYLDFDEFAQLLNLFGQNPLQTGEVLELNTRWNSGDLGEYYFYPNTKSRYLGEAGLGDTIEFNIKLLNSFALNPDFGEYYYGDSAPDRKIYSDFSYNLQENSKKFNIAQSVDFELSYSLGGTHSDWFNLLDCDRCADPVKCEQMIDVLDTSWDFMDQSFTVKMKVPDTLEGVSEEGNVKIYLRPTLNNAYRESIWPLKGNEVKKFRGILAQDASIENDSITVKYAAADASNPLLPGDTLKIRSKRNGLVESYTVNTIEEVSSYDFKLTLSANLSTNHLQGDQVYIDLAPADVPADTVMVLKQSDGFLDDWNTDHGFGIFPEDPEEEGYLSLMTSEGDLNSPANFLGVETAMLEGNWTGANNYSNPFWNAWCDAKQWGSEFLGKISDLLLRTPSNKYMYLGLKPMPDQDEFLLNTTSDRGESYPQFSSFNNRGLVVWKAMEVITSTTFNYDIYGRWIDMDTGEPIGSDIIIKSDPSNQYWDPVVSVSEDRTLVVWDARSEDQIGGQWYNTITGDPIGNDFIIESYNVSQPSVSICGQYTLVVWSYSESPNSYIRARWYETQTGDPIGDIFTVNTTSTGNDGNPQVVVTETRTLVVWQSGHPTQNSNIHGRWFDTASRSALGNEFIMTTTYSSQIQHNPVVSVSNNRALLVWDDYTPNKNIYGRWFDWTSGAALGDDFLISTTNTGDQLVPEVKLSDGRALVVWESWDSSSPSGKRDIRGRWLNISTLSPLGNDFKLNIYNDHCYAPSPSLSNGNAIVVWYSYGYTSYDLFGQFIKDELTSSPPHGLNNFMVAPLIERDYEVTAKIVK